MKIIQICNVFYPAPLFGTELTVYKIAKRGVEKGYRSVIITSDLGSFAPIKHLNVRAVETYEGIRIVRCRSHKFPKLFPIIIPSLMHILREQIESSKDEVVVHSHTYLSLNSFFPAVVRVFGSKVKLVHQPHYHPFPGGTLRGCFARRICDLLMGNFILNSSDAIVVMSKAEMNTIKRYNQIHNEKFVVIPHGVDKPSDVNNKDIILFREKYGIKNNDIVLLCVSRIGDQIIDFFIKFLLHLDRKVKVLLIGSFWGSANRKKAEEKIKSRGVEDRFILTGYLAREELAYAFLTSNIFVKPAYFFEAFGIVFMEAMSYGLPIVTHKIGALPEIVIDNENGYIVEHSDNEIFNFKNRIESLIEDKDKYKQMSSNNIKKAKNYLWDDILERYFELYEELASELASSK